MGVLITSCTNRKRFPAPAALRASALRKGEVGDVAADWVKRLASSADRVPAGRLYAGRSFTEAVGASAALGGEMLIVSAGLGLVPSHRLVPPYALSAVPGSSDSVLTNLPPSASSEAWWECLCNSSPFHAHLPSVLARSSGPILVALSEAYLSMIGPQLAALEPGTQHRLRVFTRAPQVRIPIELQPYWMPYDDRLDGPDSHIKGTKGDFASRAARDFAEVVIDRLPNAGANEHRAAVLQRLCGWGYPPVHARTRLSDEELLTLLRDRWDDANGQSSRLLRVLRDELNVACEQGRFVGLMNRLRAERKLAA